MIFFHKKEIYIIVFFVLCIALLTLLTKNSLETRSKASDSTHILEAESGIISSSSELITDSSASGGKAVRFFGQQITSTPTPSPSLPTSYGPQGTPISCDTIPHSRRVPVTTFESLQSSINTALPGDLIVLAPGTYTGQYLRISGKKGTATQPITICGTKNATVEATAQEGNSHGIWLQNSANITLYNFNIRKGNFSIFIEWSDNITLNYMDVGFSGLALIHAWKDSKNLKVTNSILHDAGIKDSEVGEGIYLGSNNWWWDDPGFESPDKNDNFEFMYNKCFNITAECVDIKEGVTGGIIKGNYFDGSGMIGMNAPSSWSRDGTSDDNYIDSWVDIKGNSIIISENYGDWLPFSDTNNDAKTESDGFEVTGSISGWGQKNIFSKNYGNGRTITQYRSGLTRPAGPSRTGVWYTDNVTNVGNKITCDNIFVNFQNSSRIPCQ